MKCRNVRTGSLAVKDGGGQRDKEGKNKDEMITRLLKRECNVQPRYMYLLLVGMLGHDFGVDIVTKRGRISPQDHSKRAQSGPLTRNTWYVRSYVEQMHACMHAISHSLPCPALQSSPKFHPESAPFASSQGGMRER